MMSHLIKRMSEETKIRLRKVTELIESETGKEIGLWDSEPDAVLHLIIKSALYDQEDPIVEPMGSMERITDYWQCWATNEEEKLHLRDLTMKAKELHHHIKRHATLNDIRLLAKFAYRVHIDGDKVLNPGGSS